MAIKPRIAIYYQFYLDQLGTRTIFYIKNPKKIYINIRL